MADVEITKSEAAAGLLFSEIAGYAYSLQELMNAIIIAPEDVGFLGDAGRALVEKIGIFAERGSNLLSGGNVMKTDDEWLFSPRALEAFKGLKGADHA